jgi:hypothetical protein
MSVAAGGMTQVPAAALLAAGPKLFGSSPIYSWPIYSWRAG